MEVLNKCNINENDLLSYEIRGLDLPKDCPLNPLHDWAVKETNKTLGKLLRIKLDDIDDLCKCVAYTYPNVDLNDMQYLDIQYVMQ